MPSPFKYVTFALLVACTCRGATAQIPTPQPEHAILKHEVGTWKAELKTWVGPDGKADPNVEPQQSSGKEVNRMMGPFWVISEFDGDFGGMKFEGHAVMGYDAKLKKFVASWTDSLTPTAMHMIGTYDQKTKTLTYDTKAIGINGEEVVGKSVTTHEDDDHRKMTMYEIHDGKEVKSMEILYTREK